MTDYPYQSWVTAWCSGNRSCSIPGNVRPITWMGDCLLTGKLPSRYVPNQLGKLSLPSLRGRLIEYQLVWLGLRPGEFTCVV